MIDCVDALICQKYHKFWKPGALSQAQGRFRTRIVYSNMITQSNCFPADPLSTPSSQVLDVFKSILSLLSDNTKPWIPK